MTLQNSFCSLRFRTIAIALVATLLPVFFSTAVNAESADSPRHWRSAEYVAVVGFKNGQTIHLSPIGETIPWQTIDEVGKITDNQIPLGDIKRILIVEQPVTVRLAQVMSLVSDLSSDDYQTRISAEASLREIGSEFHTMIEEARKDQPLEGRLRLDRIMESVKRDQPVQQRQFDSLLGTDKRVSLGNLDLASLELQYKSQPFRLQRDAIETIDLVPASELPGRLQTGDDDSSVVDTEVIYTDQKPFYGPAHTWLTFDSDYFGREIPIHTKVNDYWLPLGCQLHCEEEPSSVDRCRYDFQGSRSREHGICNRLYQFDGDESSYVGTMRIEFRTPGRRALRAGVNQVSLYLENTEPRNAIVEAYNEFGHRMAISETLNETTSFFGFNSSQPIAYLKIRKNVFLPPGSELNELYAVDDLSYSEPVDLLNQNSVSHHMIKLRDGQRLACQQFEIAGNVFRCDSPTLGELPLGTVDTIIPGAQSTDATSARSEAYVMLRDGSVVAVEPGKKFQAIDFDDLELDESSIVGVWGADAAVYYCKPSDLDHGKIVVSFPLMRAIIDDVEFSGDGARFQFDERRLLREPHDGPTENDPAETNPDQIDDINEPQVFDWKDCPPVWFAAPVQPNSRRGILATTDGQILMLGADDGFAIEEFTATHVSITHGSAKKQFPIRQVRFLKLPP